MLRLIFNFGLKGVFKILKWKWIEGECKHLCDFCKYSSECFKEL